MKQAMIYPPIKRRLSAIVCLALLLLPVSCGTLLYPERQGQRPGKLDPAILLLDGALLILFVVPGLVAYGVDFATGAIYLPESQGRVSTIRVEPEELTDARIEQIVREHTGKEFSINDPKLLRFKVDGSENFEHTLTRLRNVFESTQAASAG